MAESTVPENEQRLIDVLSRLENRIERIEQHMQLYPMTAEEEALLNAESYEPQSSRSGDELEFELGQNWFAKVGIVVLALGVAFALTLPFEGLPAWLPTGLGIVFSGAFMLLAHIWRNSFELISKYIRGGGMALLFFAVLRLFFFSETPALHPDSAIGLGLLLMVVGLNIYISLRRTSPYLLGLSMVMGYAIALVTSISWITLILFIALPALALYASRKFDWLRLAVFMSPIHFLVYFIWSINNPILGNEVRFISEPITALIGPYFLLVSMIIFAAASFLRANRDTEEPVAIMSAFLNGGGGYGMFLLHTAVGFPDGLVGAHLVASCILLGIAIVFWVTEHSRYSNFVYAMLGYSALSVAILRGFPVPDMFIWLSIQSIVVVATAIWFRSRIIIVANFIIYLFIIIGYAVVAQQESGMSFVFGVVALVSARIMNWQQTRLELKTEMMRNAYLVCAFVTFPYSLYHVLPREYVAISWVGIALFYYLMNSIVKIQKYRWMGHLTLLLTVLFLLLIGITQLTPAYRILSFLFLGFVLVIVSLVFTRLRAKKRVEDEQAEIQKAMAEETAGSSPQ